MPTIKEQLLALAQKKLLQKIELLQQNIDEIQAAANEETKSSAGDKYETSREMLRQEREKYSRQLAEQLKLRQVLQQINPSSKLSVGGLGLGRLF